MEVIFLEGFAVKFTCATCGEFFSVKLRYLDVGDRYPCVHCRSYREFTLTDAEEIERQIDPRPSWWRGMRLRLFSSSIPPDSRSV